MTRTGSTTEPLSVLALFFSHLIEAFTACFRVPAGGLLFGLGPAELCAVFSRTLLFVAALALLARLFGAGARCREIDYGSLGAQRLLLRLKSRQV